MKKKSTALAKKNAPAKTISGNKPKKGKPSKPGSNVLANKKRVKFPDEVVEDGPKQIIPRKEFPPPEELGCIKCVSDPKATGDLDGQFESGSPILLVPCDESWKEQLQYVINWKNSDNATVGYNENYTKQAGDTTAYKTIETFDELVAIIQMAAGAAVTLPSVLTVSGVNQIDNILRSLRDKTAVFVNGKKDMEILRGDVEWDFELRVDSNIKVKHIHRIEGFAQKPGLWDFSVEVAIEGEIPELKLLKDNVRNSLRESGVPNTDGLSKSTGGKKYYPADYTIRIPSGRHTVTTTITLNAGYGGLLDQAVRDAIAQAVTDVSAALQSLVTAASNVLNAASGASQSLQDALNAASAAAVSVLSSFLSILNALLDKAIGYIKLYRSTLSLECVHTEE